MRSADCSGIPNRVSVGTRPHVILTFFSSQDYNIENQARTPGPLYPDLTDPFRVSCSCGVLAADRTRRDAASTPSGPCRGLGQRPGGNYALLPAPYSLAGDGKGVPARRGLLGSTPGPGPMWNTVFSALLPVLLMILLGAGLRRIGFLSAECFEGLNRLAF